MLRWEPEGRYRCTTSMVIAPFWFSKEHHWIVIAPFWVLIEHLWIVIAPFWLSTDDIGGKQTYWVNLCLKGEWSMRGKLGDEQQQANGLRGKCASPGDEVCIKGCMGVWVRPWWDQMESVHPPFSALSATAHSCPAIIHFSHYVNI